MIEIYALNTHTSSTKKSDIQRHGYDFQNKIREEDIPNPPTISALDHRLVKRIISEKKNINPSTVEFGYTKYGKPFVKKWRNLHFNISHSGSWIVCAIGQKPVGIDIQIIYPVSLQIAKKFLSETEFSDLVNVDEKERMQYFFELWTLKESFLKTIGRGFNFPFRSISIKNRGGKFFIENNPFPIDFYFKQYNIGSSYKMALCSTENCINDFINEVNYETMIQE
jgi:4'-phosphopantetheinyl transferase